MMMLYAHLCERNIIRPKIKLLDLHFEYAIISIGNNLTKEEGHKRQADVHRDNN